MPGKIQARWIGYPAFLPDGSRLEPGVTVAEIGYDQAHESHDWQPLDEAQPSKAAPKAGEKA